MATRPKDDLAERLRAAELAIDNTLGSAEIQAAVTPFGYPAARMQESKALLDTARRLRQEQTSRDGAKEETTRQVGLAEKAARNAHADLAKIARALLVSDKPALTKLGLTGRTPQATAAFLQATDTVFANALSDPALLAALSRANYDTQ